MSHEENKRSLRIRLGFAILTSVLALLNFQSRVSEGFTLDKGAAVIADNSNVLENHAGRK